MMQVKYIRCVVLALAMLVGLPALAGKAWRGDVNGDGKLSVGDLAKMIQLLGSGQDAAEMLKATPVLDVNKDGKFSKADVDTFVQVLLGKVAAEMMNVSGGFADDDQDSPAEDVNPNGGFSDSEQSSPSTEEGGGGGFKDDDMTDPS